MRQELRFYRTEKAIEIEAEGQVIATLPMIEDDGYIEPIGIGEWTDSAGRSGRSGRIGRSVQSGRAALMGAVGMMGGLGDLGVVSAVSVVREVYMGC